MIIGDVFDVDDYIDIEEKILGRELMEGKMKCEHDLAEMETACAVDGLCPICLLSRVRALEEEIRKHIHNNKISCFESDGTISMVKCRGLDKLKKLLEEELLLV